MLHLARDTLQINSGIILLDVPPARRWISLLKRGAMLTSLRALRVLAFFARNALLVDISRKDAKVRQDANKFRTLYAPGRGFLCCPYVESTKSRFG